MSFLERSACSPRLTWEVKIMGRYIMLHDESMLLKFETVLFWSSDLTPSLLISKV